MCLDTQRQCGFLEQFWIDEVRINTLIPMKIVSFQKVCVEFDLTVGN
jgi:hypothetical protein